MEGKNESKHDTYYIEGYGNMVNESDFDRLQAEVDRLTKEKSELVSVLTDFTAWCEYPDVSKVLGMSQATIFHTAKDLLTRIK